MCLRRKIALAAFGTFFVVVGLAILALMLRHEPTFYHRVEIAAGTPRKDMSKMCAAEFTALLQNWMVDGDKTWEVTFTEAQLNSFFEEDFLSTMHLDEVFAQQGIYDPRIALEHDKIRIAFRYGTPPWSVIVSYDLKLWLAPGEENVICVEFLGRHAGALPIATQSLLNDISDVAAHNGLDVTWYRHGSNPVALVKIQQNPRNPSSARLKRLEVKQGWMVVGGAAQEPVLSGAAKTATAPSGN